MTGRARSTVGNARRTSITGNALRTVWTAGEGGNESIGGEKYTSLGNWLIATKTPAKSKIPAITAAHHFHQHRAVSGPRTSPVAPGAKRALQPYASDYRPSWEAAVETDTTRRGFPVATRVRRNRRIDCRGNRFVCRFDTIAVASRQIVVRPCPIFRRECAHVL